MEKKKVLEDRIRVRKTETIAKLMGDCHPSVMRPIERIRDAVSKPLILAVMGEFSSGKSTFINQLLGIDTLPVSIMPKTATLTKVVYGDTPQVEVEYIDGGTETFGYECLKTMQNAKSIGDSAYLHKIESVKEVRVFVKNAMLKCFTLMDTPGFNHDDVMDNKTTSALNEADIVVWLSDYSQLAKKTEFERLEAIRPIAAKLYLIINKTDVHVSNSSEFQSAHKNTMQSLQQNHFLDLFDAQDLYLISSRSKSSVEFWDAKFQQFISNFSRNILNNDLNISIDLIKRSWDQLLVALKNEQAIFTTSIQDIKYFQDWLDEQSSTNRTAEIVETIQPQMERLVEAVEVHYKKNQNLASTKLETVNTYITELLYDSVSDAIKALQCAYDDKFNTSYHDFMLQLIESVDSLSCKLSDVLQAENTKSNLAQLYVIQEYLKMQLDIFPSSRRASLTAMKAFTYYFDQSKVDEYGVIQKYASILSSPSDSSKSLQDLRLPLEQSIQSDIHLFFSDRMLTQVIREIASQEKITLNRLSQAVLEMEESE